MNQNELKKIASLAQTKYRKEYGLFIVEGLHGVSELAKSPWKIANIIATHEAALSEEFLPLFEMLNRRQIPIERVSQKEFVRLTSTETPQGIMAVVDLPEVNLERFRTLSRIVIADGIADPGNLGTIIRSAVAFGFEGLITSPGSADIFSPKTVRATQGALFSIIVANHVVTQEIITELKASHKFYALTTHTGADINSIQVSPKMVLIVGAEIAGISKSMLAAADIKTRIPMIGPVESLNAAMAATIAMYQLRNR
jgi:RNA methyltransferase, TrmH family